MKLLSTATIEPGRERPSLGRFAAGAGRSRDRRHRLTRRVASTAARAAAGHGGPPSIEQQAAKSRPGRLREKRTPR